LTHWTKAYKTWDCYNEGIMKISTVTVIVFFFSLIVCMSCFAQQTQVEAQTALTPDAEKGQLTGGDSSKKETQQFVIRVKTKQKVDFSGTVTNIDPVSASLSIRNQGKTISFDMSRVILIGYGSVGEIKKGDEVSVGYTQFGLQVRKGIFAVTQRESVPHREVVPLKETVPRKVVTKAETAKPQPQSQRSVPIRMKDNKNPTSFKDIDNNKDGKITPIELCVLVPDLSLQKFKEYDKNGDGCLNEREFSAVKRTR
jgi:hypothetical protein